MYGKFATCAVMLAALAMPAFAQSQSSESSARVPAAVAQPQPRPRVSQRTAPCWKQAGMTPQEVNQRWKLEDQGKVEVAHVCINTALGPEQKRTKIEEINQETARQVANLIPAKQLEAFNSCQAELDKKRPATAEEKKLGPCGGVLPQAELAVPPHSH